MTRALRTLRRSMMVFTVLLAASTGGTVAVCQETPPVNIRPAEQNNLAALVELAADRLGISLDYPREELQRLSVTLRLAGGLSETELWALTNRLLAAHGYASIETPGQHVLSIVKLPEAAKRSRVIEKATLEEMVAGFASVALPIEHMSIDRAFTAIQPFLSQPGGQVVRVGEADLLIVADLTPRLREILGMLERLDRPRPEAVVERITLTHVEASHVAAQITAAAEARNALTARPLPGRIAAATDGESVIVVAPASAAQQWRELVSHFDQRETVETRTYQPRHFGTAEVAALIEQTAKSPRGGSGDRWRLVRDDLTGSVIVTATPREHERIAALLDRLAQTPIESRRHVRPFMIRNRSVNEVIVVLERLVASNVLQGRLGDTTASEAGQPAAGEGIEPGVNREQSTGTEEVSLTADEGTNTLIAIGPPRALDQIEVLLRSLDIRQPQVELEVFVVNLSDSDTLDLGVELQKLEISGSTLIGLSSLFGLSDLALDSTSPLIGGRGFSGVVLSPGDFSVVIRALKTVTDGSSRSYPRVVVNNNEQATLDSVRQEPFQQVNASDTVATTSFGGTLDAGTQITVTPHIAEGDHLVLEYAVSLSAFVGESADPSLPPPRQQTRLQSAATIPDGYTVVLGGLEVINEAKAISQVPLLGDIPGVGELFKNRSHTDSRSRFYVFIRANILRHDGFEDLKYFSDRDRFAAEVDDGWPRLKPRVIK